QLDRSGEAIPPGTGSHRRLGAGAPSSVPGKGWPMCRWVLAGSLVVAACGSSSGGAQRPVIQAFVATPDMGIGDGGVVNLSWSVSAADSVSIAPGIGNVTPPASGSLVTHVSGSTSFTLTASGSGGNATGTAQVQVCDPAPASLTGTCTIQSAGQCIDFS